MPLNIHYILKSKVNSNDKVGNSIEKGAFTHVLKDLFHVMVLETCVKNVIFNWQSFSAVMCIQYFIDFLCKLFLLVWK